MDKKKKSVKLKNQNKSPASNASAKQKNVSANTDI